MPDELLQTCNFFDLYPMDGGGGLFSRTIIPTFDDREFADYILNRDILKEFGGLPRLDHGRFERWRSVEKSCWLNRFYFIVPLAKKYALTGGESLARLVVETMLHFIGTCPPPADRAEVIEHILRSYRIRDDEYNRRTHEENMADETDIRYAWFDFQPASRLLHWMYAVHFLRGSASVTRRERETIAASLYRHAEVIYHGEKHGRELKAGNNHQSLRALALLYAGAFFRGFGLWREFLEEGIGRINFHAARTFAADGSELENSPSYHIFTTWHIRDAILLSLQHGFKLAAGIEERLRAAMEFMKAVTAPDGSTVVLNDGYAVNGAVFRKSLGFVDSGKPPVSQCYFPDAGVAVYNLEPFYLLLDVSPYTGRYSHDHGGKNALTLWAKGRPFLADSGRAPYDDPSFSRWDKQPQAHSSLLINGQGDGFMAGLTNWKQAAVLSCSGWKESAGGNPDIASELTSPVESWRGVRWQRRLEFRARGVLVIRDEVRLPSVAELVFIFNLHPDVVVELNGRRCLLRHPGGASLELSFRSVPEMTLTTRGGQCYIDFAHRASRQLMSSVRTDGCFQSEITVTVMS